MKIKRVDVLGMVLDKWTNKSCIADFGLGNNWATLYYIESKKRGEGDATELLQEAKKYYEKLGKQFGGSVALNDRMKKIYKRLKIKEYTDDKFAPNIKPFFEEVNEKKDIITEGI